MKRCDRCKHGIASTDDQGEEYVTCAILPPSPVGTPQGGCHWVRPPMALHGFCGQFKLSWRKLLFRDGART